MRAARAVIGGLLVLLGCGESGFPSASLLEGYRVIALVASPPELPSDATTRLFAVEYDPATLGGEDAIPADAYYVWSVCPFALGAVARYACVDPRLEVARRGQTPHLALDLGPRGLNLDALLERARPIVGDAVVDAARRDGLTLTVRLVSGRVGGGRAESVRTVRVVDTDEPNRNPVLADIAVDGPPIAGASVVLRPTVVPASLEVRPDADGVLAPERLRSTWFVTAGELPSSFDLVEGVHAVALRLPDRPGPLRVYLVVRDERGGTAVGWRDLIVTAPP